MIKIWAIAACIALATFTTLGVAVAQQRFSAEQQAAYMSECTASPNGEAALCQCVWDGMQARMTLEEYTSLDAAVRSQQIHPSLAKYELILSVCNGTSRVTASNPEAYPGHTSANFMNGCVQGGTSQAVCACSMNEFERSMPLQTFTEIDRMLGWGRGQQHPAWPQFVQTVQACSRQNP